MVPNRLEKTNDLGVFAHCLYIRNIGTKRVKIFEREIGVEHFWAGEAFEIIVMPSENFFHN